MSKSADVCFGSSCESDLFQDIKNRFGADVVKSANKYAVYDFGNDDVFIEVKSRRTPKNRYPDTMIGYNKIRYFLDNPNKKSYCVFNFTDGAYYVEVNQETVYDFRIGSGGRRDRGHDEIKQYYFIPVKLLSPLVETMSGTSCAHHL